MRKSLSANNTVGQKMKKDVGSYLSDYWHREMRNQPWTFLAMLWLGSVGMISFYCAGLGLFENERTIFHWSIWATITVVCLALVIAVFFFESRGSQFLTRKEMAWRLLLWSFISLQIACMLVVVWPSNPAHFRVKAAVVAVSCLVPVLVIRNLSRESHKVVLTNRLRQRR